MGMGVCHRSGGTARNPTQPTARPLDARRCSGKIRPEVWVSDMLGSQKGHGVEWQVCLDKHILLRDAKYAIECGDTTPSAHRSESCCCVRPSVQLGSGERRFEGHDPEGRIFVWFPRTPARPGSSWWSQLATPGRKLRSIACSQNRAHLFVFMTQAGCAVHERHIRAPSPAQRDLPQGEPTASAASGGRKPMPLSARSSAPPRPMARRSTTPSGSCCQC